MPWFKVDDQLHEHRKPRLAGKSAMGVWVLAGSWCMDNLTDGFVPEAVVARWGTRRDAAELVKAGLWHQSEKDGEKGWVFHDWAEFQPTAESVEADRAAARERMRRIRAGAADVRPNSVGTSLDVHDSQSRPRSTVVKEDSQSLADQLGPDGLTRIARATGDAQAHTHALATAEMVLAKAKTHVSDPTAYVVATIMADPARYRVRKGAPKRHQECDTHPGQHADNCGGCAADRKAAS